MSKCAVGFLARRYFRTFLVVLVNTHTYHEHQHHTIHENHDNTTKTQTHTGTNSMNTKHATTPHRCEDTRSPHTHSHHTTPLEHRDTHPATTQHTMLSQFVFALKMTIKQYVPLLVHITLLCTMSSPQVTCSVLRLGASASASTGHQQRQSASTLAPGMFDACK